MSICPKCGTEYIDGVRFCANDGPPLGAAVLGPKAKCPKCGTEMAGAKFCPRDGTAMIPVS